MEKEVLYENFIKEMIYEKANEFVGLDGIVRFSSIKINDELLETSLLITVKVWYGKGTYTLYYSDGGLISVDDVNGENVYRASAYSTEPKTIEEIL